MTSEEILNKWKQFSNFLKEGGDPILEQNLVSLIKFSKEDQREEDARIAEKCLVPGNTDLVFPHNNACNLIEQAIRESEIK